MNKNTFSINSDEYAKSRPQYPDELFYWLASNCTATNLAWDCATGNGQSAISLSKFFSKVYASDISKEQVDNAAQHVKVSYFVNSVEDSGFPNSSFDLITAAQSLHWFNFPIYWSEVQRVAKENALFSAWGYDWVFSIPELDEILIRPFREVLDPFWNKKNKILWRGYVDADVSFPFERLVMPKFEINEKWPLQNLINYFYTWSAYKLADFPALRKLEEIVKQTGKNFSLQDIVPITMPLKSFAGIIK